MPIDFSTSSRYPSDVPQYQNLRQVLDPNYAILPAAAIKAHMENAFGPDSAERYEEYLEGIFGDIGNAFKSAAGDVARFAARAAPIVATVGGGALQGALSGAQFGLPGIIGGLATGGAGAALSRYGSGTARDIGGALTGRTNIAGQFSPLGRIGSSVGPAISSLAGGGRGGAAGAAVNALSGLLGGAAGGAGGPLGALGGLLGGGSPGGAGGALGTLGGLLGGGPGGASGAASALTSLFGGSGATSQLLSLLQRPETMQALAALNLGGLGRRNIPVGSAQTPVPAAAISKLIGELAEQASAEAAALSEDAESGLRYMTDHVGEFVGDPALDRDRAARVWNLLNEAQAERVVGAVAAASQPRFSEARARASREALDEAYYDALDRAELDALSIDNEREDFAEDYGEDYGELDEGRYA